MDRQQKPDRPSTAVPRAFAKAVEQRQQLYLQLCKAVWDRGELGVARPQHYPTG
jgi:hypothetical protein